MDKTVEKINIINEIFKVLKNNFLNNSIFNLIKKIF